MFTGFTIIHIHESSYRFGLLNSLPELVIFFGSIVSFEFSRSFVSFTPDSSHFTSFNV